MRAISRDGMRRRMEWMIGNEREESETFAVKGGEGREREGCCIDRV